MQKKNINFFEKKLQNFPSFFFSPFYFILFFLVGNHLKHVEMQKQKFKYFFKMAAIAAILDFAPSPKSNGMILGPYLIPPPSFVEIRRGVFP